MSKKKREEITSTVEGAEAVESPAQPLSEEVVDEGAQIAARVSACNQELGKILEKYRCNLEPSMLIRGGKITTQISIVPLPLNTQKVVE